MSSSTIASEVRELDIEFLFLDLNTCTRCRATDATLVEALARTAPALEAAGVTASVTKTLVADEETAQRLRFRSSPTIRINGVDVAGELVESTCESCGELCACDGGVACRDWVWQGERSTEPPVGLIVEAIMGHAAGLNPGVMEGAPSLSGPFELPDNLRRFFATAASRAGADQAASVEPASSEATEPASMAAGCCAPNVHAGCC